MTAGSPSSDRALWRAVTLMGRQLLSGLDQRLQDQVGISMPDYEILQALALSEDGKLRAGQLGDMLAWEKSRTSHHVGRMEARGLIARAHCESDLRGTWVALVAEGQRALERAEPVAAAYIRSRLTEVLEDADKNALAAASVKVLEAAPESSCMAEVTRLAGALGVYQRAQA